MATDLLDFQEALQFSKFSSSELLEMCQSGAIRAQVITGLDGAPKWLIDRKDLARQKMSRNLQESNSLRQVDQLFGGRILRVVEAVEKRHGLNNSKLASLLDVHASNITYWKKKRVVPLRWVGRLCSAFQLTPNQLMEFEPLPGQLPPLRPQRRAKLRQE